MKESIRSLYTAPFLRLQEVCVQTLRSWLPGIETTLVYRHDLRDILDLRGDVRVTVQQLRSPEPELLRRIGPVNERQLAERGARGDICYVGSLEDERPVHYAWVQTTGRHHIGPAGVWYDVQEKQAWIYDCYTAKWARRRGIYPVVLTCALAGLKQSGVQE